jgi:hypothetical protein
MNVAHPEPINPVVHLLDHATVLFVGLFGVIVVSVLIGLLVHLLAKKADDEKVEPTSDTE